MLSHNACRQLSHSCRQLHHIMRVGSCLTRCLSAVASHDASRQLSHIMDWQLSHIMFVGSCLTLCKSTVVSQLSAAASHNACRQLSHMMHVGSCLAVLGICCRQLSRSSRHFQATDVRNHHFPGQGCCEAPFLGQRQLFHMMFVGCLT